MPPVLRTSIFGVSSSAKSSRLPRSGPALIAACSRADARRTPFRSRFCRMASNNSRGDSMQISWNMMLAVAREYGYTGPETPSCHGELENLAEALAEVDVQMAALACFGETDRVLTSAACSTAAAIHARLAARRIHLDPRRP